MSTSPQFRLLDLPNELVTRVVELIDSVADLRRMACTCRRVQELVEPLLYRELLVNNASHAKGLRAAFESRSQRALAVQELKIPANPAMVSQIEVVGALLRQVQKVKDLMIESPLVNSPTFEDKAYWTLITDHLFHPFQAAMSKNSKLSTRPLQQLTSLTLHLNGPLSPYWTLDYRSLCIFQHHSLQNLHVSCMNLSGDAFSSVQTRFCTPLKQLVLEECNITVSGLKSLLTLPKALEVLYLGENCNNFEHFEAVIDPAANLLFHSVPEETLNALKQQAHSLKALTYASTEKHGHYLWQRLTAHKHATFESGGFADFFALEKIHLIGKSRNFEHAVLCGRSPPRLQELVADSYFPLWKSGCRKVSDRPSTEELIGATPFLRVSSPCVPESLTKITVNYVYKDRGPAAIRESERTTISETAKAVKDTFGLILDIGFRYHGRYFPPFLHGEPLPREGLWYDGTNDAFSEDFEKEVKGPPYPFDDSDLDAYTAFY